MVALLAAVRAEIASHEGRSDAPVRRRASRHGGSARPVEPDAPSTVMPSVDEAANGASERGASVAAGDGQRLGRGERRARADLHGV